MRVFSTAIGKKLLVALTGLFLSVFLFVHCYINLNAVLDNAEERFNRAAHFMGTNILIRISEIGLFAILLLHIGQSLALHFSNKSKRKNPYIVTPGNKSSKWYTRSMGLLGTLILLFLVVHLYHFWVPSRITHTLLEKEYGTQKMHNLYAVMQEVFSSLTCVIIYIIGCISLGWHLYHGIKGACRTLGLVHTRYLNLVHCLGGAIALIIPGLFAAMPLLMYFKITINAGSLSLFF